jgi:hypothetical protein
LRKEQLSKLQKQREEDEAADKVERWKEYDLEEEAKLIKQKTQSAKHEKAIPDPPQREEPTSM